MTNPAQSTSAKEETSDISLPVKCLNYFHTTKKKGKFTKSENNDII